LYAGRRREVLDTSGPWSWREASVDHEGDYLTLGHDDSGEQPLALIGPPRSHSFPVEMLMPAGIDDATLERVLVDVRRELDFYLVELGEESPWHYAIYHCGTTSNALSKVHWGWRPKDSSLLF
jgi:hypothetical protein